MKATKGQLGRYELKIHSVPGAELGRIIVCAEGDIPPREAASILRRVADGVAASRRGQASLRALITCGGFLRFDWPDNRPIQPTFDELVTIAEEVCQSVIDAELVRKLRGITRFFSFGVDSSSGNGCPHVELVALLDLDTNRYHWTGKCYPTLEQQETLVAASVESHALTISSERILLLGCHDLTAFNPRAIATAKGKRRSLGKSLRKLARDHGPTLVLQHPHVTDTERSWQSPWAHLKRELPPVLWAGAGRFVAVSPRHKPRGDIDLVRRRTASQPVFDVLVVEQ